MTLRDSDGYIVESAGAAESLPDPTLNNGRTHLLTNTGTATAVWSSTGATPFFQGGVAVATVSLTRGQALQVQSDGTRWVAKSSGMRPYFAATAVTDGSGNATFTFPAGLFPAAPIVSHCIQAAASNNPIDQRVTALTATSCTVNVRQSPIVVVLSLSVVGASAPLAGATIHLLATPSGSTP